MRRFIFSGVLTLVTLFLAGCASAPAAPQAQQYYLDPSVEMHHYHTYGFLQVMACRYLDEPMPANPAMQADYLKRHKHASAPVAVHYTDEIVWRVLQLEMEKRGYEQVEPTQADILIAYYGGPRPLTPMKSTRFQPCPFDEFFVRNELTAHSFFVDIIDTKRGVLLYRGWDNGTYLHTATPEALNVIHSTQSCIGFFPSVL